MTRDGELVVYHDASLIRFFNSPNKVRNLTWDELRRLNFSSALPTEHVTMPSLVEVLEQLENKYLCNIEVKKDRVDYNLLAGKLLQILRELDVADLVWISSFDSKFLQSWVKLQSEIPAALLFDCFKPLSRRQIKKDWAEWLHPGVRLLEYYPKFRETGKPLCVWTVNRKEDLKICKELGVDAVITDNVPEALKVLSGDKEEIDEQS
ncbi:MAG: glycerophosphodiester phosphodiesterase [Calditrichia bacterium]